MRCVKKFFYINLPSVPLSFPKMGVGDEFDNNILIIMSKFLFVTSKNSIKSCMYDVY